MVLVCNVACDCIYVYILVCIHMRFLDVCVAVVCGYGSVWWYCCLVCGCKCFCVGMYDVYVGVCMCMYFLVLCLYVGYTLIFVLVAVCGG